MKTSSSSSSRQPSSTLFAQPLRKNGLRMILEPDIDTSLGLELGLGTGHGFGHGFGPVYTIDGLKAGTTNADVAARLQCVGDTVKWSAKHRKAATTAAKGKGNGVGNRIGKGKGKAAGKELMDGVASSAASSSGGSSRASSESG